MSSAQLVEVNEPARKWAMPPLRDVWEHRELLYYLGRRDLAVRYKQTVVGVLWAVLQPLMLALIFSLFLGLVAKIDSPNGPYSLFVLVGMTMWLFFSTALAKCSESTVGSVDLISKVYFPRLIIPLAALIQPAVDFLIAAGVLLVVMVVAYGVEPGVEVLLVPAMFLLAAATALGIGLWLSALIVRYRDIKHVVPFLILSLLFTTPVIYALEIIPESYRALYALNPLVAVMEGWRWAILPDSPSPGVLLLIPLATSIVLIVTGLFYFQRAESSFADVI